jgi:exopolyphosphatase/guanosine-5'-triphosphate,3'-diphosphate pyrophosphatase
MIRDAAVDLGTNSTRLLVADVDVDRLDEVTRRLTITRLGEGVDQRRRLLPVPIARVRNCLTDYRQELEALGAERTLCIATSSVRDAENGEAFLGEIEWSYGFTTRLLSGDEEAAMMIRGVTAGRPPLDDVLVVDIGGGSTELVVATEGEVSFAASLDVGCVRITERFLGSDPPTRPECAAASAYVRSLLPPLEAGSAIGVAGTVTTLATLDLGDAEYDPCARPKSASADYGRANTFKTLSACTHGHRLSLASVEEQLKRLAAMTTEQRVAILGIEPGRASVIVAGIVVLREVMTTYGLPEIEVSERDVLHGAAFAAGELTEPEEGAAPPGAYTCC